jgi:hypothetical protein
MGVENSAKSFGSVKIAAKRFLGHCVRLWDFVKAYLMYNEKQAG